MLVCRDRMDGGIYLCVYIGVLPNLLAVARTVKDVLTLRLDIAWT